MNTQFSARLSKIEDILSRTLPDSLSYEWLKFSFGEEYPAIKAEHAKPLSDVCNRLIHAGGKRWRPLLLVLCAEMQKIADKKDASDIADAYKIVPLLEFVHTASLIHDDIEDGAQERRGLSCAHIAFGLDTAINAGSWLYFEAAAVIENIKDDNLKLRLYRLFAEELRRLHLGQAMDIAWHRDTKKIPTTDEYLAMVKNKTGTLSSFAAKAGVLIGGGNAEAVAKAGKIAADIGAGFQVLDDVINLMSGNVGKKRGDDITEGKKSLPALIYLQLSNEDGKEKLFQYFEEAKRDGIDSPAVEKAILLMEKSGAISAAFSDAKALIKNATAELHALYPDNSAADLIEELFVSMMK